MSDLAWQWVHRGTWLQSQVDWQVVLFDGKRIDPYLIWTDLTLPSYDKLKEERLARNPKLKQGNRPLDRPLGFIIEFDDAPVPSKAPPHDLKELPLSHNFAAWTPRTIGSYLVQPASVHVLVAALGKGVVGFELSVPRAFDGNEREIKRFNFNQQLAQGFQLLGKSGFFLSEVFASGSNFVSQSLTPVPPPLVCIADDGCNFASAAFGPRVDSIWDQDDSDRVQEQRDQAKREWSRGSIAAKDDENVRQGEGVSLTGWCRKVWRQGDPPASEPLKYRQAAYMIPARRWTHGSAVLDVLLGRSIRLDPPEAQKGCQRWHDGPPSGVRFVQLPNETVLDTSGASLAGHALDAVLHALQQAVDKQDVIVNLSYGTHSGPHDGSSMFERSLAELLDYFDGDVNKHPNCSGKTLHVVLPAGNSHLSRCHATKCLPPEGCVTWYLKVLPDDPTDNHVEIWTSAGDEVAVTVLPPGEDVGEEIKAGQAKSWGDDTDVFSAVIFPHSVPQGKSGSMALLAIGPTRRTGRAGQAAKGRRPAPHGIWKIAVRNLKKSNGTPEQCATVHAWVQRGDLAPGRGRDWNGSTGRQPYFLDLPDGGVAPEGTLNGIACFEHPRLFVVGAMRANDSGLSAYSAAGPNRNSVARLGGPDLVTVADESLNMPGLLLRGTSASTRVRVSGTSIAAPLAARMLYEHLAAGNRADTFKDFWDCRSPSRDVLRTYADPHRAHVAHRGDCDRLHPTKGESRALVRARRPPGQVPSPPNRTIKPGPQEPPVPPLPAEAEAGAGDRER